MGLRGPGARPVAVAKPASSKRKRVEALRDARGDGPDSCVFCSRVRWHALVRADLKRGGGDKRAAPAG